MKYNPRYSHYCASNHNIESAQLIIDKQVYPGGCMCGFIIWISEHWREFKLLINYPPNTFISESTHIEFDNWLQTKYSTK